MHPMYLGCVSSVATTEWFHCAFLGLGIPSPKNAQWNHSVVATLLTHPRYIGCIVFNQTTRRLGACWLARPRSEWIITSGAHQAIVAPQTFASAQEIIASRSSSKTNDQL